MISKNQIIYDFLGKKVLIGTSNQGVYLTDDPDFMKNVPDAVHTIEEIGQDVFLAIDWKGGRHYYSVEHVFRISISKR